MAFPLQQLEGKYEILEKIAEGGMGAVYKVRHRLLEEVRVIKVMRPQLEHQEDVKSRFLREAKIAVRMRHPNIAQMYDFSIDDAGTSFIVMEYIDGVTLQDLLKRSGPPGVALCLEIAQQSLQALGYLHRKGIVHRDISPDNLMLCQDEVGEPAVKLIDLGIAKPSHGESNLTATGLFLGKIKYASPEHFKAGEGVPVDQRSDLYCFGLVLYELLTGVHAVAGTNWSELIAGHLFEKPRDFATTDPDGRIPEELRQVVLTALAKSADERYPDAKTFRRAILQLQTELPGAQEEFERYLQMRQRDLEAKGASRAGTTQERLDAEFSADRPTPAPTPSAATAAGPAVDRTRQVTPAATSARTRDRVRELLDGARRLAELNLHEEAALQARAAQQLDPGNPDVAALLEAVEAGQRRAQLVEARVETVDHLLAQDRFGDARVELDSAAAELGDAEELVDLRARLEQLEAQHRFARAAVLVKEAQGLVDAQSFGPALARLEQAEDLDPGNTVVRSYLAEVRQAMREHEHARRQATLVSEKVAEVEALLAAGNLDRARQLLDESLESLGLDPALVELGEQLAARVAADRAAQVDQLVRQAAAASARQDHGAAVAALEQALEVDPDNADAAARLTQARSTLKAREEGERQAAEIAAVGSEVESLLASNRPVEARARLDQALGQLGLQPALLALGDRILEREAQERSRTVRGLLEEASSRADGGDHAAAVEILERALALDSDNREVSSRLETARAAQEEAQRRLEEVGRAAAEVDELVAAGQAERALERAQELTAQLGPSDELTAATERAAAARDRERARRLEALLADAEAATARGDHPAAVEQLEAALRLDPDHRQAEARLKRARKALERAEEDARRAAAESLTRAVPTAGDDRTMATPTAEVAAAPAPEVEADRTTALPVPEVAEPAPPADRTVAVPAAPPPEAPPAPAAPRFKPRGPTPARPEPAPVTEAPAAAPSPARTTTAPPTTVEVRPRRVPWPLVGGVAAVLALVVAVVALWPGRGPSTRSESGMVVVNAVPWAQVESIVDADSNPLELAPSSYTPLAVELPPGRYRISLRNPQRPEPVEVEVEVAAGATARAPLADFGAGDASAVLGKYGL